MRGHTIILRGPSQRAYAQHLIREAGKDAVVTVEPPRRTLPQNSLLWSLLSDLSRACPDGIEATSETWKELAMHACGHEIQFKVGLNGIPFPAGFRSSKLSKEQMSELIEFVYQYGAERGVKWTLDPTEEYAE